MITSAGVDGGDFVKKFRELTEEKDEVIAILNSEKISKLGKKQLEIQLRDIEGNKKQIIGFYPRKK